MTKTNEEVLAEAILNKYRKYNSVSLECIAIGCIFCDKIKQYPYDEKATHVDIEHEEGCPVLVAQSIFDKMTKVKSNEKVCRAIVEKQARALAYDNRQSDSNIEKVYWFPNNKEVCLVYLEKNMIPALSGRVEPFYFTFSETDGSSIPAGIAIIEPEEFGNLKLPRGWCSWDKAILLDIT